MEKPEKVTKFQQKVFEAVQAIPRGKVTSYKELSKYLEVRSAQAVGQALKRNPRPIEIPCHRVIHTDGFVGHYFGSLNAEKTTLLQQEGVDFTPSGYLKSSQSWWEREGKEQPETGYLF